MPCNTTTMMTHWHTIICKSAAQRWKDMDTMCQISYGRSALTEKISCWRSTRMVQAPTHTHIFSGIKMGKSLKSEALRTTSACATFPQTALSRPQFGKKSYRPTGLPCAGRLVRAECSKKSRRTCMISGRGTGCSCLMNSPCILPSEQTILLP